MNSTPADLLSISSTIATGDWAATGTAPASELAKIMDRDQERSGIKASFCFLRAYSDPRWMCRHAGIDRPLIECAEARACCRTLAVARARPPSCAIVMGVKERGGRMHAEVIPDVKTGTLRTRFA